MFIYVIDQELKQKLIKNGFKLLKEEGAQAVFANNNKVKFDFNKVDKSKFLFTNKLTF